MSEISEPVQRISHTCNGEPFWMDVRMFALESEWFKTVADKAQKSDYRGLAELFSSAIADWDVTMTGEPFAPTVENLMRVPIDFWYCIMAALKTAAVSTKTLELEDEIRKAEGRGQIH